MDALDIGILRGIGEYRSQAPFPSSVSSLRRVADSLLVSKETVRMRLARLQRKGVLVGWHAMVNPTAISLKVRRVWVKFPSEKSKDAAIGALSQTPSLRVVYDYAGDFVSYVVISGFVSPPQTTAKPFADRPSNIKEWFAATLKFPPTSGALRETDWKVYQSVRAHATKSQKQISADTGLSMRTIKRRLKAMAEGNLMLIVPEIDPDKIEGVSADLLVGFGDGASDAIVKEVAKVLGNNLMHMEVFEEPCALFTIIANNISRAKSLSNQVLSVPGVADSHLFLLQNLIRMREPLQHALVQRRNLDHAFEPLE